MGVTSRLRKKLPGSFSRIYYQAVPFSRRYEKTYRSTLRELLANEDRDTPSLLEAQCLAFFDLLEHASTNVPFYRNYFREHGLTMRDFGSIDDIKKLPVINKEIINRNPADFLDERLDQGNLVEFKTSGSTGVKFIFKGTDSMFKKEAAFVTRAYHAHGSNLYRDWSFWIRRYVPEGSNAPLFKKDYELRRIYMSAYHLNNRSVHDYVKVINEHGYHTISTYPSSAYSLACLLEEENLSIPRVKSIHLASEMLIDEWKTKIESVLPAVKIKAHYGQMEKTAFFHQADSDDYLDNVEYGVTEFVETDGQMKVIGTGFLNRAMPFIRYDTGDAVEPLKQQVMGRGLPARVKRFIGRSDDIIVTPEGNRLPGVNFYTMMYKIPGVKMFQIVQESKDEVRVRIVPHAEWSEQMSDLTKNKLTERLGSMKIYIEECTEIERSSRTGKIRCILNAASL
jgi:phenylacetate-CoA ligase